MNKNTTVLIMAVATGLMTLWGCPDGDDDDDSTTAGLEWSGSSPHFRIKGKVNNENLDLTLEGAAAQDVAKAWCEREYLVPMTDGGTLDHASGYLWEVRAEGIFTVNGQQRRMELELKRHNFQRDAVGTQVKIIPRPASDVSPPADSMWLEMEWHARDAQGQETDLYEGGAQDGTCTLKMFEGTPDTTGLIIPENTGTVGALIQARWSQTESVEISFTLPCTTNEVVQD